MVGRVEIIRTNCNYFVLQDDSFATQRSEKGGKDGTARMNPSADGKTGGDKTKKRVEAKQTRQTGQTCVRNWFSQ
jgi:hypothetical protein